MQPLYSGTSVVSCFCCDLHVGCLRAKLYALERRNAGGKKVKCFLLFECSICRITQCKHSHETSYGCHGERVLAALEKAHNPWPRVTHACAGFSLAYAKHHLSNGRLVSSRECNTSCRLLHFPCFCDANIYGRLKGFDRHF